MCRLLPIIHPPTAGSTSRANVAIVAVFFPAMLLLLSSTFAVRSEDGTAPAKVTNLRMSTEEGLQIYQHWTNQAFTSLLSAFLQAKINANELPIALPDHFSRCYHQATTVPAMAKCICRLFNDPEGKKEVAAISVNRLDRLKGKRKKLDGKQKQQQMDGLTIGEFKLEDEENQQKKPILQLERKSAKMPEDEKKWQNAPKMPSSSKRLSKYQFNLNNKVPNKPPISFAMEMHNRSRRRKRFRRNAPNLLPHQQKSTSMWERLAPSAENEVENELAERRKSQQAYELSDSQRTYGMSPVGGLARMLMATVLGRNNKTEARPWQKTVAELRALGKARAPESSSFSSFSRKSEHKFPAAIGYGGEQKPRSQSADIRRFESRLNRLERLQQQQQAAMAEAEQQTERRNSGKSLDARISQLVRDGIRIGMLLANRGRKKKKNRDEAKGSDNKSSGMEEEELEEDDGASTMEVLSPRFLSITERKGDEKSSLFSPSVFSLHNKGKGIERELSLPNLLKGSHLTGRDQQEWLDLIMEASGVNRQFEAIKEQFPSLSDGNAENSLKSDVYDVNEKSRREFKELCWTKEKVGQVLGDYEKRKIDTWAELDDLFTEEQRDQMNRTGFSMLDRAQLEHIYGPSSPFNDSKALARLRPLLPGNGSMAASNINELIESDIRRMAELRSFEIRRNDVVLSPSLFRPTVDNSSAASQPFILSPVVFSPTIRSPTILGPAILSPSVFSPIILSPRVMTPLVLSPFIFSSTVLSPVVMQPFILSPGVINGVILSPFVMNPNVLSPQVMHPFILSPLVMTPGILNPTIMSPLVLSPFVMNPQILSPKALAGLFLSPYALTPVLLSPTYFYLVFLSPGFLS